MMPLAVVTVAAKIGIMVLGIGLSILAGKLLAEKARKSVLEDDKPTTLSQRGSFVPVVLGIRRVGAIFAWAGDRFTRKERVSGSKGGKGGGAGGKRVWNGGGGEQTVFVENGWHILCVGPADRLWKIWQHGEIIFGFPGQEPLTPSTHPSGTTVDFGLEGLLTIFWGEKLQPINTDLGDASRIGISSRWPFMCYIYWERKRLGTSPIWPLIEYEIEVRPNNTNLSSSDRWITPERGTIWSHPFSDVINKQRDFTTTQIGSFSTSGIGAPQGVSTMDEEDNVIVVEAFDTLQKFVGFSSTLKATVDVSGSDAVVFDLTGGYQPSGQFIFQAPMRTYIAGRVNDSLFELAGFSSTQNSELDISAISNNPSAITMWKELAGPPIDACFASELSDEAYRLTAFTTTVKTTIDVSGLSGLIRGMSADGLANHILFSNETSDTLHQMAGFTTTVNATVDVGPISSTPKGIAHERNNERLLAVDVFNPEQGANAAHMIDQLLFEKYPKGIGLSLTDFDLPSLEAIGTTVEFDDEYQPSNLVLIDGEKFQAAIAAIMQDIGLFISWDVSVEKYVFTIIREPAGLLPAVTLDLQIDALPERTTIHDDLAVDRVVFSFSDRARNYRDTTITMNDDGQAELVGVTKARNSRMTTITDFLTAQKVSERRAQEEMFAPTRFNIKTARAFRTLVPGEAFTLDGLAPVLRLLGMGLDTESDEVVLDCIIDSYGI